LSDAERFQISHVMGSDVRRDIASFDRLGLHQAKGV
jgi:hypothetical protein